MSKTASLFIGYILIVLPVLIHMVFTVAQKMFHKYYPYQITEQSYRIFNSSPNSFLRHHVNWTYIFKSSISATVFV